MAIHPYSSNLPQRRDPVDVAEWTTRAAEELANLSLTAPSSLPIRGTSVQLDISLDDHEPVPRPVRPVSGVSIKEEDGPDNVDSAQHGSSAASPPKRREPLRRDSLKRREALLKGKEGSRRRQRWENGV